MRGRTKSILLLIGDLLALYVSLFLTLFLRYQSAFYDHFIDSHFFPFSFIFILWILVFYIAGLYDIRHLRNSIDFLKNLGVTISVNALLTITFFYLIPAFGITPKLNLFIFIVIFTFVEFFWRRWFNRHTSGGEMPHRILLLGNDETTKKIHEALRTNPQFGYEVTECLTDEDALLSYGEEKLKALGITGIVLPRHTTHRPETAQFLYRLLELGIEVRDAIGFYELIFQKLPLRDLQEEWFLSHISAEERFYDELRRAIEFLFALLLGLVLLPLELLIALLIKLTSPGPVIYRQVRIGQHGIPFTLYKFRTMRQDAEKNGAQWASKNDARVTFLGKILRHSHLDELPQLWNILKNELAFVGPRPERPEFVKVLEEKIPYYAIRHLVKPGVTGWAQINYRYGASIEDAVEKLQYEIYYLKNRSPILDVAIILKTIKSFFVNH